MTSSSHASVPVFWAATRTVSARAVPAQNTSKAAAHTVDATFRFAANHHNPIECSVTAAMWNGDSVTVYDATQGIVASQLTIAAHLGISPSKVRVVTDYVGGGLWVGYWHLLHSPGYPLLHLPKH